MSFREGGRKLRARVQFGLNQSWWPRCLGSDRFGCGHGVRFRTVRLEEKRYAKFSLWESHTQEETFFFIPLDYLGAVTAIALAILG